MGLEQWHNTDAFGTMTSFSSEGAGRRGVMGMKPWPEGGRMVLSKAIDVG